MNIRKRTSKFMGAAILAAAIFGADRAADSLFAQCPGGNCQAAAGYYYPAWSGWYWPGFYYGYPQQPRANCPGGNCPAQKNAQEAPETPADAPEFDPDKIPECEPESAEGAAEEAEPKDPEPRIEIGICPMAAIAADLINKARTDRGLPPLAVDGQLSAACERHSAFMKARGFGHAADGGRECIAEGYSTPAAAVSAWMNSDGHRAIILGPGTRIGIGVVGRFYTLRIR